MARHGAKGRASLQGVEQASREAPGPSAAEKLRQFLEVQCGSTLKAWINTFDNDNDQRISKMEFSEGMRALNYDGKIHLLFAELDDDGSGELTLNEIDEAQAEIWTEFRAWCVNSFKSVEDVMTRLSMPCQSASTDAKAGEGKIKRSMTRSTQEPVNEEQFTRRVRELGWTFEQEKLLFHALDGNNEGVLGPSDLRWLGIELRRLQRKMHAKSKAIQSLRKNQSGVAQKRQFDNFKAYLKKKHGNLVRAWRVVLTSNDSMILPKTHFLKACAKLGFAKEAKDLWRVLDKDDSGFASLDELEPKSGEVLAHFKAFVDKKFGTPERAFAAMDVDNTKKVYQKQFEAALLKWGWDKGTKQLFHHLDKDGSKTLEDSDLKFLEKWNPLPYLLVQPNHQCKEEVKKLLLHKFGRHLKAWRHLLDRDGSNRCNWQEFQMACKTIGYQGDVAGAWRAFDDDLSGYITLKELDEEAHKCLYHFKTWACEEFGTVKAAFGVFDDDGSNQLSFQEFRGSCRVYGYAGEAKRLFTALDVGNEGTLSMKEVAFLDDWDLHEEEEGQQQEDEGARRASFAGGARKSAVSVVPDSGKVQEVEDKKPSNLWSLKVEDPMRLLKVVQVKRQMQHRADLPIAQRERESPRQQDAGSGEDDEVKQVHSARLPRFCQERQNRERKSRIKDPDKCREFWLNYQERVLSDSETDSAGPLPWAAKEARSAPQPEPQAALKGGEAEPEPQALETSDEEDVFLRTQPLLKPTLDELLNLRNRSGSAAQKAASSHGRKKAGKRLVLVGGKLVPVSSMKRLPSLPKLRGLDHGQALPVIPHTVR